MLVCVCVLYYILYLQGVVISEEDEKLRTELLNLSADHQVRDLFHTHIEYCIYDIMPR